MADRDDATQVSQHQRAKHAKRNDLEITLMIAGVTLAAVLTAVFAR